jgi:hypothetical protein
MRRHLSWSVVPFLALTACPSVSNDHNLPEAASTVRGVAPWNREGKLHIISPEGSQLADPVQIAADGTFEVALGSYAGTTRLEAEGGWYPDLATETRPALDHRRLRALASIAKYKEHSVVITPWTELAASVAERRGPEAYETYLSHISAFLSCDQAPAFVAARPDDPTVAHEPKAALSDEVRAGLALAGLSQQAQLVSEDLGISPGTAVSALSILDALNEDLSDGVLDGFADGRDVFVARRHRFTGEAMRSAPDGFARGVHDFLASAANKTGIAPGDTRDWLECLSSHRGPLFGGRGGGKFDQEGPEIQHHFSDAGGGMLPASQRLGGTVVLHLSVADVSGVAETHVYVREGDDHELPNETLVATTTRHTLDLTALGPSPLRLRVVAMDRVGNRSEKHITAELDNEGPDLALAVLDESYRSVAEEDPHRGTVILAVSARDVSGIAKLFLFANGENIEPGPMHEDWLTFPIDTSRYADGALDVAVVGTDGANNSSRLERRFWISNAMPSVMLTPPPPAWVDGRAPVQIDGSANVPLRRAQVELINGVETAQVQDLTVDGTHFWGDLVLPGCGREYSVRVIAEDLAGNAGGPAFALRCDNQPPQISLRESVYLTEPGTKAPGLAGQLRSLSGLSGDRSCPESACGSF